MSRAEATADKVIEERMIAETPGQPDRLVRVLRYGIFLVVVTMMAIIIYAILSSLVAPPAPRTRAESLLATAGPAVKKNPKDGKLWADYIQALYISGDKKEAYATLKQAYKSTRGKSILLLYNLELSMLIKDGKNKEAVDKSTRFVQEDIYFRVVQANEQQQNKVVVPIDRQNNGTTVQLFTLRATAQGNLKQWKEAVISLDNALKLVPEAADVQLMRGWAKLEAKDKAGAKKDFEQVLKFLPGDSSAKRGLALATAREKK